MSSWTWVHSQDSVEAAKETPRLIISFHTISLILSWKPFQLAQKSQRWKEPSPFELKETSLGTEVKHDQNSLGGEATSEQALESDSRKKFIRGGLWVLDPSRKISNLCQVVKCRKNFNRSSLGLSVAPE